MFSEIVELRVELHMLLVDLINAE